MIRKSTDKPVLTIMVPVYNEQDTIKEILTKVSSLNIDKYELIIVDDASKDKSNEVIRSFIKSYKNKKTSINLLKHKQNQGKGAAIKTALKEANGIYFVIQDADLEYDPKDIEKVLNLALTHDYKAVYGSRFKGVIERMPKPNYYANKFYNFMLRRLYNTDITDMHTCYKMVKTELLKSFDLQSDGFDYATELISKLLKKKVTVYEVPISFKGRTKKEGKKIDFKDGLDCIAMLIKYKFQRKQS